MDMEFMSGLYRLITAIIVLLVTIFVIKILRRIWSKGDNKKLFPPMAGTIFHQLLNFSTVHDYHTKISRKYKTFRLFTPFGNQTYTVDPENIEYILRTNFKNYGKVIRNSIYIYIHTQTVTSLLINQHV